MNQTRTPYKWMILTLAVSVLIVSSWSHAEIQVKPIAPPPATAKLRVFVQPLTDRGRFMTTHQQYERNVLRLTAWMLEAKGIYEVVPGQEVKSVFSGEPSGMRWDWARKNWGLARRVGRALHADYTMVVARSLNAGYVFWEMVYINIETGKHFKTVVRAQVRPYFSLEDYNRIFMAGYRELFQQAKGDMLGTAIRKGRIAASAVEPQPTAAPQKDTVLPPPEVAKILLPAKEEKVAEPVLPGKPEKAPEPAPAPVFTPSEVSPPVSMPPVEARVQTSPTTSTQTERTPDSPPAPPSIASKEPPEIIRPVSKPPEDSKVPPTLLADLKPKEIAKPAPPQKPAPPEVSSVAVTPPVEPSPVEKEKGIIADEVPTTQPQGSKEPADSQVAWKVLDLEKILTAEGKQEGRRRLAVYDLEAMEPYRVVALILSEALREELIRLGQFNLVNRENLIQVLKEIELQMTGLVDEKQAVQVGKGLAANQIVMGRYGLLGKISILQAKRVDVESQGTLAMGSLKCSQGQEDELLAQMPDLARKLAGLP